MNQLRSTKMSYYQMCNRCGVHPKYLHVSVCQRWLDSIDAFIEDMGLCPPGFTIDRINVSGNYEPANCRWATRSTQQRNKRINRPHYNDNPLRCIRKEYHKWVVCMTIYTRDCIATFNSLDEAIDCRNQWDYEREIHHLLFAPNCLAP